MARAIGGFARRHPRLTFAGVVTVALLIVPLRDLIFRQVFDLLVGVHALIGYAAILVGMVVLLAYALGVRTWRRRGKSGGSH